MAYLVITINASNATVQNLIDKTFKDSAGTQPSLERLAAYLSEIACGATSGATVQFTVRDNNPSVATHGTGSVQVTHSKA